MSEANRTSGVTLTQGTTDGDVKNPIAQSLNPDELKVAIRDNVCNHREFIRDDRDREIKEQQVGIVSFKFLETPLQLPDGELFFGWYKLRGNHPDEQTATAEATNILKHYDSKSKNKLIQVGAWSHLTSSKMFTKEFTEYSENQFLNRIKKEEAEQKEQVEQIRAREKKLSEEQEFDPESLDYYITKNVSLSHNEYTLKKALERVKQCRKNIDTVSAELKRLDKKYPQHKEDALGRYNEERVAAGMEPVKSFEAANLIRAAEASVLS